MHLHTVSESTISQLVVNSLSVELRLPHRDLHEDANVMQRALCMFILGHLTHLHLHVLQNQLKCLCTTSHSEVNVVTVHDYRRTQLSTQL